MVSMLKEKQLARQFELEDRLKAQEIEIRMQKLRDETEVAKLIVEVEEMDMLPDEVETPEEDKANLLSSYLATCHLASNKIECNEIPDERFIEHDLARSTDRREPIVNESQPPVIRECRLDLPKVELSAFFVDITDYWRFSKQFEFYVEARISDPGKRLLYLMNYCKGAAKEEIKNCIMLQPDEAYHLARKRLRERFGQSHVIARALIDDMLSLPRLQSCDPILLSKMVAAMQDCKLVLGQMNYLADMNSIQTLGKLVSKLPIELRQTWSVEADRIYGVGREPGVDDLILFIDNQARIARSAYGRLVKMPDIVTTVRPTNASTPANDRRHYHSNVNAITHVVTNERVQVCPNCNKSHALTACPDLLKLSVEERWNLVRKLKLCFLCLKGHHQVKFCRNENACGVEGCARRHNSVLHQDLRILDATAASVNACNNSEAIQLGIVPVIIKGPKAEIKTYAMLDNGSDTTLITQGLLNKAGLTGRHIALQLRTVTGEASVRSVKCDLVIDSLDREHSIKVTDACSIER